MSKTVKSGAILGRLFGALLKICLPLMKNVLKLLSKSVLISVGLTGAASTADAGIHKINIKMGVIKTLTSNKEMDDIMKLVKPFEESGLLMKGVSKTIKYKAKEQNGGFLSMLWGTLVASLFENLLTGKGMKAEVPGWGVIRAGKGTIRTSQGF